MKSKLTIQTTQTPAIQIHRNATTAAKLVYVAVVNKRIKYPHGNSRIGYIGTTKVGADRIAASAAAKSKELLDLHGIKSIDFFVVTCKAKKNVLSWRKLERGLLLVFRESFGVIPKCNSQGKKMKWTNELNYFSRARLKSVIDKYS